MVSEWTGASVDGDGGKPSPDVWTPVDVPGRPDAFAGAETVAYRTTFDDPRDPDEDRAVVELRGLYARAEVWLNDRRLGSHDAYFRPFRHAFEPEPTNELVVACHAPDDRFGGVHDTDLVPEADAVPGIWWDVDLETHAGTFVSALSARPRLVEGDALIDVRAVVEAVDPVDDRVTFSLRPEGEFQSRGMMDRATVTAAAGERATVEHTIEVRDPSLWWPRELGPQHRYSVRAKLGDATRSVTTGIRSVSRDSDGLHVNGERLPVRGVNAVSATVADVDRALAANANLLRMHAHVPSPAVYEYCDERGLLVWQDLPLTGPGPFGVQRGRDLAAALGETFGRHPALATLAVHDDPVELCPEPLGAGLFDRLRLRWRARRTDYDRGPAETVAAACPADLPVFPVVGPVGIGADATTVYPGWDYGDPGHVGWVLDRFGVDDAVAEFGAGALGSDEPSETAGFDAAKHATHASDDPAESQRYQATVIKRVAETLRRRDVPVQAAFALRDAGDAGMGVLGRDGTEKEGYRALRHSFQPVQATLVDPSPGGTGVVVCNDTGERVAGRLTVAFDDQEAGEHEVAVDAHGRTAVTSVAVPADVATVSLVLSTDGGTVENRYHL